MKQFFLVVFGGLAVLAVGVGLGMLPKSIDRTFATGFGKVIYYPPPKEDELIHNASLSLPTNRDITAESYIVLDLATNTIIADRQKDSLLPIASLTKLVTAVIARRLLDSDERITITRSVTNTYGDTAKFRNGEIFLAEDLLYPLLMVSSNDAAEALARHAGRKRFVQAMNDFAQSIGAYRTYFRDPSGLSPENVSTVSDIARIMDWIRLHESQVIDITATKTKIIRGHTWVNPVKFLSWSSYVGGKNGYIPEADRTAALIFDIGPNKNPYTVIVLGSSDRDGDIVRLLDKISK